MSKKNSASSSSNRLISAVDWKVREHPDAVVVVEFEAYPEPKVLSPAVLAALAMRYGGFTRAARAIGGVSEGFVRQNMDAFARPGSRD